MSYWGYKPYVSVAERQKKAEKAVAKAKKDGVDMSPIAAYRGALAKTFWGKAWCDNLEHYSDYANRLPRGRTYVRNGSVIDLRISAGEVQAQVMGSELYKVKVKVAAVPDKQWKAIGADCSGSIDSLVELLQGKLSTAVMERICKPEIGLFPAPKEITLSCSCPDWASMCKHVAAVLYGVGAQLDQQPELIFRLRRVDAKDLVTQAGAGLPKAKGRPKAGKLLDDSALGDVFGIEMAEIAPPKPVLQSKATATKAAPAKAVVGKVKPPAKPQAKAPAVSRVASTKGKAKAKETKATVAKPAPVKAVAKKPKTVKAPAKTPPVSRVASAKGTTKVKESKVAVTKPASAKASTSKAVAKHVKPRNEHGE